jgi:hypothetical protein
MSYNPVPETRHPNHLFSKRSRDHLFLRKCLEDSGLCGRWLPSGIAYDMGADVDAQLNRLDRVEKDDALQLPVAPESGKTGVLLLPGEFEVRLDTGELARDERFIYQRSPS